MQHRGCQSDAGELGHPEVTDNCRIREEKQRFGDQGTEGRDCEAQNFPPACPPRTGGLRAEGQGSGRRLARNHPNGRAGVAQLRIS